MPPSHLADVGAALAKFPEVAYVTATTGPANLAACAVCRDEEALYEFLTAKVGALPGVERVETAPIIRTVKQASPVDGAALVRSASCCCYPSEDGQHGGAAAEQDGDRGQGRGGRGRAGRAGRAEQPLDPGRDREGGGRHGTEGNSRARESRA